MHPVILQTIYYGIVILLTFLILGGVMRGFLFKYLKVRTSFGKYVLVKIRSSLRNYFRVGWVEDNFLIFKEKIDRQKLTLRFIIPDESVFYRCLGINWVDIDEATNSIVKLDFSTISGFDNKKFSDLHIRALMRPSLNDNKVIIFIVILIFMVVLLFAVAYLSYRNFQILNGILPTLNNILSSSKTVIGSAVV